ncbi:MAG: hypothetical protein NC548_22335 [Lachnospiraceae bacterium]|nr:hypothetical protein [Lachnospiraceae bacterium]
MERLTIEYCGEYVPKELCSIDRLGGADDCDLCCEYCKTTEEGGVDCTECAINHCFNKLGFYENVQERIEKRIRELKASTNYPHNFMGQMVDDFEWVLKLIEQEGVNRKYGKRK